MANYGVIHTLFSVTMRIYLHHPDLRERMSTQESTGSGTHGHSSRQKLTCRASAHCNICVRGRAASFLAEPGPTDHHYIRESCLFQTNSQLAF
jgi:hypothetical protein